MLRLNNIRLKVSSCSEQDLINAAGDMVKCRINSLKIIKKSIDARHKNDIQYVYCVDVSVDVEDLVLRGYTGGNIQSVSEYCYNYSSRKGTGERPRPCPA